MYSERCLNTGPYDFRSIIASSVDGFTLVDSRGDIIDVNDSYCQMLGYTRDQLLKMHMSEIDVVDSADDVAKRSKEIIINGSLRFESKQLHKDGSAVDVEVTANYTPALGGSFLSIVRDITLQKQTENAFRQSEERFRSFVENANDITFSISKDGIFTYVSPNWKEDFGHELDETIGKPLALFVHPDDISNCFTFLQLVLGTGKKQSGVEYRVLHKNGSYIWYSANGSHLRDAENDEVSFLGIGRNISERKKSEKALREREFIHQTIISTSMDGFWRVDGAGHILEVNETYSKMSGYSSQELTKMSISDLDATGETKEEIEATIQKIKLHGEGRFEVRHRRKDGSLMDLEVSVQYRQNEDGRLVDVAFLRDITERKESEKVLRITRFSIEHSSDGIFWMTPDAHIMDVNEAACSSLGYSREELLQLTIPDIDPYYNADVWRQHLIDLRQHGSLTFETVHTTKDGIQFPVEIVANYIMFGSEECNCAIVRNITERKQHEQIIQRLDNLYAALSKCGQVIVQCNSEDDLFQEICKSVVQIGGKRMAWIGLTDPETKLLSVAACYGSGVEYLDDVRISVDADTSLGCGPTGTAIRENRPVYSQDFMNDPTTEPWHDGGLRYSWKASGALPLYRQGTVIGALTMYSDVINAFDDAMQTLLIEMSNSISYALDKISSDASRKKAEEALNESEIRFRSIFKSSPIAIGIGRTSNGEMIDVNDAWLLLFGYERDEVIGHTTEELSIYPKEEDRYQVIDIIKDRGLIVNHPVQLRHKSGAIMEVLYSADIVTLGSEPCLQVLMTDVTANRKIEEEKQLFEQQLQHTQKLESLGVLSGGIAHDFNNILAIIIGYCGLIKMDYETAENNILEIENAVERAAGLCRQMLAYAGKAQISMTQVNMWMLVDEMVNMLKATLPRNAVIKPELSTNIPFISADASQVRQIVMNLIINASEAIGKEQGEIRVSLTKSTVLAGQSEKDYHGKEIPPGSYVCLEVTDTGCGMDEETKWRIFEPFYTTKFTGRGLGMSAVLGIIKSHNGALQLFSQLGQGTTFKVYLPVQKNVTTGDEDQVHTPSSPWQGSGTILLVEDEDQIRHIAKTLLEMFGFTVIEAVNGKEALELYQKNAAEIRLVLTDIGMPVMDGYALFPALKKLDPELPIIISSGFGDTEVSSRIGSDNIAGLISKPFNPSQLREVLKSALEGTT